MATIIYTLTDEAPMLATYSFLPVVAAFASSAGVDVATRDISLGGRILASFPEHLTAQQRVGDALTELGELATTPEANIIKLPNISASMPQLKAAISELQAQGYALPDYPEDPRTDEQREVAARYDKIKGSAVNPVLREGNSDRRAPAAVKNYARRHPHSMGAWSAASRTEVATMQGGDFRANEQSVVLAAQDTLEIRHVGADGTTTVLKAGLDVLAGEVVDATVMHVAELDAFLAEQIARAKGRGRPVLGAPQGDDDEGQRPDHLRPRRPRLLPRRIRGLRRRTWRPPASRRTTAWAPCSTGLPTCPTARRSGPRSRRAWPRARPWRWSTRTGASPTCTSPVTSSWTPRCRR